MAISQKPDRHPGGRPPKYKTPEELQAAIDKYFEACEGTILKNKDGDPVFNKYGDPVYIGKEPPTMSGLAIGIGFIDRSALLNYEDKDDQFYHTVRAARARVEHYAETRLYDKEGSNGAKFSLSNNFRGWKDKSDIEINGNIKVEDYLKGCEDSDEF